MWIDVLASSELASNLHQTSKKDATFSAEWKKLIQKYHDYQIEWLTSHFDLELEPTLESWIIRFLHDTANMFILEEEKNE